MAPMHAHATARQHAVHWAHWDPRSLGLGSLRVLMGFIFLWAFLDKTFGLGFATKSANAWIDGGSPTRGFLANSPQGPFQEFFNGIAGNPLVDVLFMTGLAGVGIALLFGIGLRIAAVSGGLMMLLMWAAVLPPAQNPLVDDHIVYAIVLLLLPVMGAGNHFGLGEWWSRQRWVQRYPVLR